MDPVIPADILTALILDTARPRAVRAPPQARRLRPWPNRGQTSQNSRRLVQLLDAQASRRLFRGEVRTKNKERDNGENYC